MEFEQKVKKPTGNKPFKIRLKPEEEKDILFIQNELQLGSKSGVVHTLIQGSKRIVDILKREIEKRKEKIRILEQEIKELEEVFRF